MSTVLRVIAAGEFATGMLLLVYPPIVIRLLFASETSGAGLIMSRLAGIILVALAAACWPEGSTRSAFLGMLTYSSLAMIFLFYVGTTSRAGPLLWPAVVAHLGISVLLASMWIKEKR